MCAARPELFTLTLNPAIDHTLVIPGFAAGQVNRVQSESQRAGGKGINVATSLAEYECEVGVLGFLGQENAGIFIEHFKRHGLYDHCLRLPGATRVGIKIGDPSRGETTDINFPGLRPTSGNLDELVRRLSDPPMTWCVLSGSLPPGVPVGFYADCIASLKRRGVRVALDTSGEALRRAIAAGPTFIKPNVHELEEFTGTALPDEPAVVAAARGLLGHGLELVVVSRGEKGACFVTQTEAVTAVPPKMTVISTVGAGDAMVAGIVAGLSQGLRLADCARLATAFSMHALTREAAVMVNARQRIEALKASVLVR